MTTAESIPQEGGMLSFNSDGVASCHNPECNWRGAPTVIAGEVSSFCPVCESDDNEIVAELKAAEETKEMLKGLGRNSPCPCGSGKKVKKCHGR